MLLRLPSTFASLISMEVIAAGGTRGWQYIQHHRWWGWQWCKIVSATIAANTAYTIQIGVEGGKRPPWEDSSRRWHRQHRLQGRQRQIGFFSPQAERPCHGGTGTTRAARGGTGPNSIVLIKNSGGSGGVSGATSYSGGGEGGAAGPNGNELPCIKFDEPDRRKWRCR